MTEGTPPIESVDRALQLLTALHEGTELSVTDAAGRLGVAASTAYRLLTSLVYRGYAVQGRDRRYRLGPVLASSRTPSLTVGGLRTLVHPALETLHERTGETVQLMVLERRNIRFIDGIECELPLRVGVRTGDQMPAHCSAGGKAILAGLGNADLDRLYQDGLPPWPTAKLTDLSSLKRQLARVRQLGYGRNHEETEQGVSGIGMAILDEVTRPLAALTVAIPSARFSRDRVADCLAVLKVATETTIDRLHKSYAPESDPPRSVVRGEGGLPAGGRGRSTRPTGSGPATGSLP